MFSAQREQTGDPDPDAERSAARREHGEHGGRAGHVGLHRDHRRRVGLSEMPPVSKVMPLPTSTTCGSRRPRRRSGRRHVRQLDQPRRAHRALPDREEAAEALGGQLSARRGPVTRQPALAGDATRLGRPATAGDLVDDGVLVRSRARWTAAAVVCRAVDGASSRPVGDEQGDRPARPGPGALRGRRTPPSAEALDEGPDAGPPTPPTPEHRRRRRRGRRRGRARRPPRRQAPSDGVPDAERARPARPGARARRPGRSRPRRPRPSRTRVRGGRRGRPRRRRRGHRRRRSDRAQRRGASAGPSAPGRTTRTTVSTSSAGGVAAQDGPRHGVTHPCRQPAGTARTPPGPWSERALVPCGSCGALVRASGRPRVR